MEIRLEQPNPFHILDTTLIRQSITTDHYAPRSKCILGDYINSIAIILLLRASASLIAMQSSYPEMTVTDNGGYIHSLTHWPQAAFIMDYTYKTRLDYTTRQRLDDERTAMLKVGFHTDWCTHDGVTTNK